MIESCNVKCSSCNPRSRWWCQEESHGPAYLGGKGLGKLYTQSRPAWSEEVVPIQEVSLVALAMQVWGPFRGMGTLDRDPDQDMCHVVSQNKGLQ